MKKINKEECDKLACKNSHGYYSQYGSIIKSDDQFVIVDFEKEIWLLTKQEFDSPPAQNQISKLMSEINQKEKQKELRQKKKQRGWI